MYLHSTMYLLKHKTEKLDEVRKILFTFHHVSIKTSVEIEDVSAVIEFTFHHVSIKTFGCEWF